MIPVLLAGYTRNMLSASGVIRYFKKHLMDPEEAGSLVRIPGYLDEQEQVVPIIVNRRLWELVGLEPGAAQIPEDLLFHLPMGMDGFRNQVCGIHMFTRPKEHIITLHGESSESMKDDPEVGLATIRQGVLTFVDELEATAVKISSNERINEYHRALTLTLAFIHALNRMGEPHLHAHVITFPMVFHPEVGWRCLSDQVLRKWLNSPDGARAKVGKAYPEQALKYGYIITFHEGLASPLLPHGATVRCPDGRLIEAGSVVRLRQAHLAAVRELKNHFSVNPLTQRELKLVHQHPGFHPRTVPRVKDPDGFVHKLSRLGLLNNEGRILDIDMVHSVIRRIEHEMAMIQVRLKRLASLSTKQCMAVAAAIESQRKNMAAEFLTINLQSSIKAATLLWTNKYLRVMEKLVAAGPGGLGLDGLNEEEGEFLHTLHRARQVHLDIYDGIKCFEITQFGKVRLAMLKAIVENSSDARYQALHEFPIKQIIRYSQPPEKRKSVEKSLHKLNPSNQPDLEVNIVKKTFNYKR